MNNMTTKELLTALPKYKSHKTVRASKIKDIEIIALMDVVLFCNIEVVEPEGVKVNGRRRTVQVSSFTERFL